MQKSGKLELTWVGKYEQKEIESRILVENPELSYGDQDTGNMLIHGDNLIALKALEQDYAGKIKCIYIDPPYNINAANEHYDDFIEHSQWLCLMRSRLQILHDLLHESGVILIQIDDDECAYLKVLCDEIFGRNNFQNMLTIETGEVFGTKAAHINKSFVKVKDYILIYSKECDKRGNIVPLWTATNELFDSHYSTYIDENYNKFSLIDVLKSEQWIVDTFDMYHIPIKLDNIAKAMALDDRFRQYVYSELASKIYQDQPYTKSVSSSFSKNMIVGAVYDIDGLLVFKTKSGSHRYYQAFSNALHSTDDYKSEYTRSTARGDLWKNYHIDMRNVDDEGDVKFKNSKKPERLIRDLLKAYTNKGDIVLDSFLGSGTTAAVAHKMGRRWIGIELGNHAYTHCKVRMDNVIDGEQGGISKSVNWQGGGGYKFYELAPSLLVPNPKLPTIKQINPEYTFEMMCEAICKLEGFKYKPDGKFHGKSSEQRFIHITLCKLIELGAPQILIRNEQISLLIYSFLNEYTLLRDIDCVG